MIRSQIPALPVLMFGHVIMSQQYSEIVNLGNFHTFVGGNHEFYDMQGKMLL